MFSRLLFSTSPSVTFKRGIRTTFTAATWFTFPARHFTTGPAVPDDRVDVKDALPLLEREHFLRVRNKLEKDERKKISLNEYYQICEQEGLGKEQASRLSKSLGDSGIILHFPQSSNKFLHEVVFLKPQELNSLVSKVVNQFSPETIEHQLTTTKKEIDSLKEQLQPLQVQRDTLEKKAHRHANLVIFSGLGYCILQFAAIGRLTWWELSWDVMEPVTYMLTFATALIGYTFFVLTGSEYTYEGLKRTLQQRKLTKLAKKNQFAEPKFAQLKQELHNKELEFTKLSKEMQSLKGSSNDGTKSNAKV